MASEERFVYNPSTVDISRSKFSMNNRWKGDVYHGDLVPIEITRVMPGDSFIYDATQFTRTATQPIAPFMDNIWQSVAYFYVPERLVWHKEKEFLGENTEGYGIQTEIKRPRSTNVNMTIYKGNILTYPHSIAKYMKLVRQKATATKYSPISLNEIRAFLQVYNDWFRNENFMAPYLWDHSQTGDGDRVIATLNGVNITGLSDLPKVCKKLDRYTSCLPFAQKGNPVLLPIGGYAPLDTTSITRSFDSNLPLKVSFDEPVEHRTDIMFQTTSGLASSTGFIVADEASDATGTGSTETAFQITGSNLQVNLAAATAANVNQVRFAFATQKYLEALARSGSKYREYIKGIFGVNIGDTTAQMAEYLGGATIDINVDQVLQTTGHASGSTTELGAPGAVSVSAGSNGLFTKSFTEPGFIVGVLYTKHSRTYGQGIDEQFTNNEILQEYNPKFANIGEQAIPTNCLYFSGDQADDDDKFGFQEAWSHLRYKEDVVIGALAPSNDNSLNFWTLAENFASKPTLNADFLTEDRNEITRVLAGGSASPDYFVDLAISRTAIRPMPVYSIPGLIDHH